MVTVNQLKKESTVKKKKKKELLKDSKSFYLAILKINMFLAYA